MIFHRLPPLARRRRPVATFVSMGLLVIAPALAQNPQVIARAPVKNFTLPFFNDAGHRTMLVKGGEALLSDPQRITIRDLTLTAFTGAADSQVETVIVSPAATVIPAEKSVTGEQLVRLVRDDIEVSGEVWRYEHDAKKILIDRNVRIVFRAELKDILK